MTTHKLIYKTGYALLLSFSLLLALPEVGFTQQIDKATGGEAISADDFNSGTFTSLSGPVITESSPGQISVGFIEFKAPAGFEWDTGGADPAVSVTLAPGSNGSTKLAIQFSSRTADKIIFEVTSSSDVSPRRPGQATFSGFRIRPTTGTLPNSGFITNTGNSAPSGNTNYGDIVMVEGAPAKIRVETKSDGSGSVVPAQDLTAGNSLTVYSISRDQNDNFLQNVAADSWSIINGTSGVDNTDLTPASDNKSAVFSSNDTGTGQIQASKSGLTATPSGTITVKAASASAITVVTQPSATATAGQNFTQQPVIHVVDVFGNRVMDDNSTQVTAARKAGTGILQGTKTLTVSQGEAAYSNLSHNIANDITIEFSSSGFQSKVSNTITVSPAPASQLAFTRQPPNGEKNKTLTPGPIVQIQDQFSNNTSVSSPITITVVKNSGPTNGDFINSTTSVSTDSSALFDDLAFDNTGTYTIEAQHSSLANAVSNSFDIVNPGVLAKFLIEIKGGGNIPDTTAGDKFIIQLTAQDGSGNILQGNNTYEGKAYISVEGNSGFGLNDSTINFTSSTVEDTVSLNKAGNFEISASAVNSEGVDVTSLSNTFTISPAAASPDSSVISASPSSIVADGTSTSLLTVTLVDSLGNNLQTGGDIVTLSTTGGTISSTAGGSGTTDITADDQGDGTYTATLTSSVNAQTATISAKVNSTAISSGNPTVDFVAGGLDHFAIEADGGGNIGTQTAGQTFFIQITAQDANNNTVTDFNGSVDISSNENVSSGDGSFSLSNGILSGHSITITGAGQNSVTISAVNSSGTQSGTSNTFTVNPGAVDAATTTITPADRFIENTGTSTTTITVQAKDQFGNNRITGGDNVTLSTTAGTFTDAVSDNGDGTYTRTLQSSTNVETATITGTINSVLISDDAQVSFAQFNVWTSSGGGSPSTNSWEEAGNWTLGVPTSSQAIVIPTNPANAQKFPIIKTSTPTVSFIEIESGATVNVDPGQSVTINNDLTGSGALIVDSGTATISGNLSIADLNAGNSTVTLDGASQQDIPGSLITDILNIQNSSTAGIVSNGYINADTRLTVSNSTLTMEAGSTLEIFNDITGTGTVSTDDATVIVGGDITVNAMDVANSDVILDGTAAQSISNITEYRNLTVSNSSAAGVTLNSPTTVSGGVTINSGSTVGAVENLTGNTLSAAGGTLRLAKDVSFSTVSSAPNTVEFFGGNPQTVGSFNPYNNLTVDKSSNRVVSNDDVTVNGTLTLTSGDLVLGPGTNLLAPNRTLSGGIIRFQLELASPGWYAISSPVASTYNDLLDSVVTQGYPGAFYDSSVSPNDTLQPNVLYYDETVAGTDNQRYRTIGDASNNIVEARGHFVFVFGDIASDSRYNNATPDTLEVGGPEFTGNGTEVDFNVTYTASADTGWNLVGNPYGATIDWDDDGNWTKTNMDNTIYVWDHTANGGNGDYLVWNGFTGSLGDGLIAPFQAFWVKANSASPVLKVSENAKTTGGVFRKAPPEKGSRSSQERHPVVEFKLSSNNLETSAFISFSEDAKRWKDNNDAYRLTPFTDTFIELYSTLDDGTQLTINNLPRKFGKTIEIPIFAGGAVNNETLNGGYTLSWPSLERIPSEWSLTLVDNNTGDEIDLNKESFYSFDIKNVEQKAKKNNTINGDYTLKSKSNPDAARFTLKINPGGDAGNLPNEFSLSPNYPNPFNPSTNIPFALPLQSRVKITVYDILGRKVAVVADQTFDAGRHTVTWDPNALASGVYLYVFQTSEKLFSKKMTFIK